MSKPLVEIEGFPQLMEKIKQLGNDKTKRQEVLKVLRQVANASVTVARANAPMSRKAHTVSGSRTKKKIQPGALKKSIGTITGKSANPTILVGPRAKGTFDGWYGNFVEKGHNVYSKSFKRKRSASSRANAFNNAGAKKRTKAQLFMQRTYEQTKGQVTAESEKKIAAYMQRQIDRLSR